MSLFRQQIVSQTLLVKGGRKRREADRGAWPLSSVSFRFSAFFGFNIVFNENGADRSATLYMQRKLTG